MYKFNIGDILICHTVCYYNNDQNSYATTVGKKYQIINLNDKWITIIDDTDKRHDFTVLEDFESKSFKTWFITLKENRLKKLKKIQEDINLYL